jgi:hypothetical protein
MEEEGCCEKATAAMAIKHRVEIEINVGDVLMSGPFCFD